MNLAEVNKGVVGLLLVLVLGAGGYLWYSMLYQPAVEERRIAQEQADAANQQLATVEADVAKAEAELKAREEKGKDGDESLGRIALATSAVPDEPLIDDAFLAMSRLATKAGLNSQPCVDISSTSSACADVVTGQAPEGSGGAAPIDITLKAAGTYGEMMTFMDYVEAGIYDKRGKVYSHGRLFNVVGLKLSSPEFKASDEPASLLGVSEEQHDDDLVIEPGDLVFTITVRIYSSAPAATEAAGAIATANATTPATGTAAAGAGATTTPATTTTTPAAGQPTTAGQPVAGTTVAPQAGTTAGTPSTAVPAGGS